MYQQTMHSNDGRHFNTLCHIFGEEVIECVENNLATLEQIDQQHAVIMVEEIGPIHNPRGRGRGARGRGARGARGASGARGARGRGPR